MSHSRRHDAGRCTRPAPGPGRSPMRVAVGTVLAALALGPAKAHASLRGGSPELYENGSLVGERENAQHQFTGEAQEAYGELEFLTGELSEGFECASLGFVGGWNEGSPPRAFGQIESWAGGGHVPNEEHPKLSLNCRPEAARAFVTDEAPAAFEESEGKLVLGERGLTTPWNIEVTCGVRETTFSPIVKIGTPTSESPSASVPCPAKATDAEETKVIEGYEREKLEHKGCYKTNPAPAGCIRLTLVGPGAGEEFAFGGTLHPTAVNGAHNGLTPARWSFEGPDSGLLQCELPVGCTAEWDVLGELKDIGYTGVQLTQYK